jgi:hypothetical protein
MPIEWRQQVRRYPNINVEGLYLSVTCTTQSDLLLSDGYKLSDLTIELSIFQGDMSAKDREQLSDQAIGGIWWSPEQTFVHGHFYLQAADYAAVWEQVRNGGYAHCHINLSLYPVEYTKNSKWAWSGNPLCIESADIYFHREPITRNTKDATKEKGWTRAKQWAVVLFVMAATCWFFPQWNGVFFEPSRDVTAGEGRIAAAVLFVGASLLWFLGSPRPSEIDPNKQQRGR